MREIKFRYYDKLINNFRYSGDNDWLEFNDFLMDSTNINMWNQYTGLKDKNGVEIYEGDIIKCIALDTVEVVVVKDIMNIPVQITGWKYIKNFSIEVLGNIYQNEDLIKE